MAGIREKHPIPKIIIIYCIAGIRVMCRCALHIAIHDPRNILRHIIRQRAYSTNEIIKRQCWLLCRWVNLMRSARVRPPLMPDSLAIFALNETLHLHTAMCFMRIADKARPTKTQRQQQNQADGKLQLANRDNPLHISVCIMHMSCVPFDDDYYHYDNSIDSDL